MHRTGVHIPSHDAPNPRDRRGKVQIKRMLSEALPQCPWRGVARPALEPHSRGGHPDGGGILHPRLRVVHLVRREHDVRAPLLRAARPLPSQHCGLVDVPVEAGAGLCYSPVWSGFCRIWSCHCTLPTLNNGPNGKDFYVAQDLDPRD